MPYKSNADLPKGVRDNLPASAQSVYRTAYNSGEKKGWDTSRCSAYAWGAVKKAWKKVDGKWVKKQEVPMDASNLDFAVSLLESWDELDAEDRLSAYYQLLDLGGDVAELGTYKEFSAVVLGYVDTLSDKAFAVVEPAYTRGETDNTQARHCPHHGSNVATGSENTTVAITAYRNARARASTITPVTDSITESALRRRAMSHLKKHTSVLQADEKAKRKERESRDQSAGMGETQNLSALMVGEVHLSEDGTMFDVPLIRAGTWDHPWYGEVVYDSEKLQKFVDNFHADVVGHDLTLTHGHRNLFNSNPANLGWIKDMRLDDGYQLHLAVHPTEQGLAEIPHNLKYASAEVKEKFVDDETGEEYGPTIVGAAATNHPYITRQGAITVFSDEIDLADNDGTGPMFLLVQEKMEVKTMEDQEKLQEELLDAPAPEVPPEVPPAPETPEFFELQTSSGEVIKFTGDDVTQLIETNRRLSRERHETHVHAAVAAAKDRGVVAAVLNTAKPILMACSEDAAGTIKFSDDGDAFNLYGAIVRLLEMIPGVTKQATYEQVGQPLGGAPEMTPEEAEQKAKARMVELGLRAGVPSAEPAEI